MLKKKESKPLPPIEVFLESVELLGDAAVKYAKVVGEVDMPGKEDPLTRSTPMYVTAGKAVIRLTAKYDVADAKDPVRDALVKAFQTEEEEDSELLINVYGVDSKNKEHEIGFVSLRLERLLATKQDIKLQTVRVCSNDEAGTHVANLRYSVTALASLLELEGEARAQIASRLRDKAVEAGLGIELGVKTLSLSDLKTSPPTVQLRAEIVGATAEPVVSSTIGVADGRYKPEFEAAFAAPAGSRLRSEMQAALRDRTLELRLTVESVAKGKASAVGEAVVGLLGILDDGDDLEAKEVEVTVADGKKGRKRIGVVT